MTVCHIRQQTDAHEPKRIQVLSKTFVHCQLFSFFIFFYLLSIVEWSVFVCVCARVSRTIVPFISQFLYLFDFLSFSLFLSVFSHFWLSSFFFYARFLFCKYTRHHVLLLLFFSSKYYYFPMDGLFCCYRWWWWQRHCNNCELRTKRAYKCQRLNLTNKEIYTQLNVLYKYKYE